MKPFIPRPTLLLIAFLVLLLIVVHATSPARAATLWTTKVDEALLGATSGGAFAEFLVVLRDQADLSDVAVARDKIGRGRAVYETMTAIASRSQAPLLALLDSRGVNYRAYWINNMIWVRGDRDLVLTLAARSDVGFIYANTDQRVDLPSPTPVSPRAAIDATIEWNIDLVNAPAVWAAGYNGEGAVIGGQDTGYDWQHEALMDQYRGWDGTSADHDYNWHDAIHEDNPMSTGSNPCGFDAPAPCDDGSHGTHTMGTMAGRTAARGIGMAPGAQWIGCRNMENGWGSPATYSECFEWFIAPYPIGGDPFTDGDPSKAPHVINNSWSCPASEGCVAPEVLQAVVEAVRTAGIVTVQSAGNAGSRCGSVDTPAAIYDASFTVGATNEQDTITSFSSRGPVTIDGSGRRKPDVVAPGQLIQSSIPGNLYAWMQGTSMAGPHVAGLVALLISADPALAGNVDELEAIITRSARPITTDENCGGDQFDSVPNNVYGWGRIDALAAFEELVIEPKGYTLFVPAVLVR